VLENLRKKRLEWEGPKNGNDSDFLALLHDMQDWASGTGCSPRPTTRTLCCNCSTA
jgi:hypothetical protein